MGRYNIYKEISERTQGDIYIGVVGPVRTGKSTFIKRFMNLAVIPNIGNEYSKQRANDELPQSGSGRTIMTTEPKFIPNEAVQITVDENIQMKVRMVDCVGYLVKNALGYMEEDAHRMVSTPWYDHPISFEEAAELGTRKVIQDHSTIGLVVTTDGSITGINREDYVEAEARVVEELKQINKPFVILLNSANPENPETLKLREELECKYNIPVTVTDCAHASMQDINNIMEKILFEFPVCEVGINIPRWIESLDAKHWLKVGIVEAIKGSFMGMKKVREAKDALSRLEDCEFIKKAYLDRINLGEGQIVVDISVVESLFCRVINEDTGLNMEGEHNLIGMIKDLVRIKVEYDRVEFALHEVRVKGYGIITPQTEELSLEEPEIVKQGNKFGVKLRASAPSIHLIRADIETEIAPLVGTEKQSEELVSYLLKEFEDQPGKIWESNIFGKSLYELVNEGLQNKLSRMPEDAQLKLQDTLQKIINEGSGGLICIIL